MEVPDSQTVVLDGLTIMKGITHNSLQQNGSGLAENEVGRGGGVYSKGVDYVLANCRLLENKAVRGGGAFLWDADLYLFNNLFAGHQTDNMPPRAGANEPSYGGALVVAATSNTAQQTYHVKAINNLWANNCARHKGGAVAIYNEKNSHTKFEVRFANNTIVHNQLCCSGDLR